MVYIVVTGSADVRVLVTVTVSVDSESVRVVVPVESAEAGSVVVNVVVVVPSGVLVYVSAVRPLNSVYSGPRYVIPSETVE